MILLLFIVTYKQNNIWAKSQYLMCNYNWQKHNKNDNCFNIYFVIRFTVSYVINSKMILIIVNYYEI